LLDQYVNRSIWKCANYYQSQFITFRKISWASFHAYRIVCRCSTQRIPFREVTCCFSTNEWTQFPYHVLFDSWFGFSR